MLHTVFYFFFLKVFLLFSKRLLLSFKLFILLCFDFLLIIATFLTKFADLDPGRISRRHRIYGPGRDTNLCSKHVLAAALAAILGT